MATNSKSDRSNTSSAASRTWNTPEAIARHRAISPEERLRKAIALSRAALRFSAAEHSRGR